MGFMKKTISLALSTLVVATMFAGCGSKQEAPETAPTDATVPAGYQWATYYSAEDAAFLPKDIFSEEMFAPGIVTGNAECGWFEVTKQTDVGAYVLKGEYGKCYELKFPAGTQRAFAIKLKYDPRDKAVGEKVYYWADDTIIDKADLTEETGRMYTCRKENEYLLICTNSKDPVYIGERTIIAEADVTGDGWYIPETVGSIAGGEGSLGYVNWTYQQVLDNLYEPVRQRYPSYITREVIGKDQSGKYDIYGYVYTPKDYEITMFLNGGTHADEQTAFFALAKVMQLIADAQPEDNLLYTLRHKVRFVVIPVLNVWGVTESHGRPNSTGQDLNRDFADLTQQESKSLISFFEKYAEDTKIMMDFHIAAGSKVAVYFNFINYSANAVANYKATNHMYHRYKELGYGTNITDLSKVPGSYIKSDKYLEGRIWNSYGVPTITVEYVTSNGIGFPGATTSEAMTAAVETQMNFIIQNALYFLANP